LPVVLDLFGFQREAFNSLRSRVNCLFR
jgi:hypothetical protein